MGQVGHHCTYAAELIRSKGVYVTRIQVSQLTRSLEYFLSPHARGEIGRRRGGIRLHKPRANADDGLHTKPCPYEQTK
jgi:hypothetical protein